MTRTATHIDHYGPYSVEVSDTSEGFRHRITKTVQQPGKKRAKTVGLWYGYEFIAQLDNMRHATNYWLGTFPAERLFSVVSYTKQRDAKSPLRPFKGRV